LRSGRQGDVEFRTATRPGESSSGRGARPSSRP
jgi:hypothetical protein